MIPTIPPYVLKFGVIGLLFAAVFYGGCHTQARMDEARMQRLEAKYERCVGIVDVFQENYDTIAKGLKDQNAAIADLGEEAARRISSLQESHKEAVEHLRRNYERSITGQKEEAAKLREKLAGLSDAEACREAMMELGR